MLCLTCLKSLSFCLITVEVKESFLGTQSTECIHQSSLNISGSGVNGTYTRAIETQSTAPPVRESGGAVDCWQIAASRQTSVSFLPAIFFYSSLESIQLCLVMNAFRFFFFVENVCRMVGVDNLFLVL